MTPITEHHTCDACGCHYPKDEVVDALLEKLAKMAELVRTSRAGVR